MRERTAAASAGQGAAAPVYSADLHDAALHTWRAAGIRDAVLIHADAHHDAGSDECTFVTIANFVWWAVLEGIVREVYWIVPDPSWRTAHDRAELEKTLQRLAAQQGNAAPVHIDADL